MKHSVCKSILIAIISSGTVVSGCANSGQTVNETSPEEATEQRATENSNIHPDQAEKILTGYLKIKNALVNTDATATKSAADDLNSAISSGDEELLNKIKSSAANIAGTSDVEQQRKHFYTLSEDVYSLIKSTKTSGQKLYRQYCPMAMNYEGAYWISSEEEIRNPYFGDKMLRCGKVTETLN